MQKHYVHTAVWAWNLILFLSQCKEVCAGRMGAILDPACAQSEHAEHLEQWHPPLFRHNPLKEGSNLAMDPYVPLIPLRLQPLKMIFYLPLFGGGSETRSTVLMAPIAPRSGPSLGHVVLKSSLRGQGALTRVEGCLLRRAVIFFALLAADIQEVKLFSPWRIQATKCCT